MVRGRCSRGNCDCAMLTSRDLDIGDICGAVAPTKNEATSIATFGSSLNAIHARAPSATLFTAPLMSRVERCP